LAAVLAVAAVSMVPAAWPVVLGLGLVGMATINENPRISDVLLFEEGEEVNLVRDTVTLVSGTPACVVGQVLGKITASGKYTQVAPAASDGSQTAAAVLIEAANPAAADVLAVAVVRPPAIFKAGGLAWTTGMTGGQKTTAIAQLNAAGMPTRTDYGV
jgi:hypothetical protein